MAFTVYRWDETGAPSLDDVEGSLLNVLRQCLVLGFGDRNPVGWTEMIEAGNARGAFQSQSVSSPQHWYHFDDRTDGEHLAYVTGAHNFTGWDGAGDPEFTDPYPSVTDDLSGGIPMLRGYNGGNNSPWIVIADERTVWIITQTRGKSMTSWDTSSFDNFVSIEGFGDTVSLTQSPAPSFIAGNPYNNGGMGVSNILQNTQTTYTRLAQDGLGNVGARTNDVVASGRDPIGSNAPELPRARDMAFFPEGPRHLCAPGRIDRLRGLRTAYVKVPENDDMEALFGPAGAGNPSAGVMIGAGADERMIFVDMRHDNTTATALFDLNDN